MARHSVLPIATPVQVGALGEEAHGGPAVLPRQTTREGRLYAFPGNPRQGKRWVHLPFYKSPYNDDNN